MAVAFLDPQTHNHTWLLFTEASDHYNTSCLDEQPKDKADQVRGCFIAKSSHTRY